VRILHLNTADRIGGAAIAAHRLHVGLSERGIDSKLLVGIKSQPADMTTSTISTKAGYYLNRFIHKYCSRSGNDGFSAVGGKKRTARMIISADVVHMHNIHGGFFSLPHIIKNSFGIPIIWTLHDMWALTGGCCFPYDCSAYLTGCSKQVGAPCHYKRAQELWCSKQKLYQSRQLQLVVPSLSMLDLVRKSPLTQSLPVDYVPFGIDLQVFHPVDKTAVKRKLGIPVDDLVVGFRATTDRQKGLQYVTECLKELKTDRGISLLVLNQSGLVDVLKESYNVVELGWISDQSQMAATYNAMDVFLMPSTVETFGLMAMESMACAVPVIAFENTVLVDTLFAPVGGITVPHGNVVALHQALSRAVEDEVYRKGIGLNALALARKHYDKDVYLDRMIEMYNRVVNSKVQKVT